MVTPRANPHIIGFTGSFGSGCTYIVDNILVGSKGYTKFSLSDVLRELYSKQKDSDAKPERRELQLFGDEVREKRGHDYLAQQLIDKIRSEFKTNPQRKWVVDSIRNPAEVRALRRFSRDFFLFGVYADADTRWDRVQAVYEGDQRAFQRDDKEDKGEDNPKHGQKVSDCFSEADVVLTNNRHIQVVGNQDFKDLEGQLGTYLELVAKPLERRQPRRQEESLMAMAYAASQRSSCMKRKVGAVIADDRGNVISSGYNEVPSLEDPCERKYNGCYRDYVFDEYFKSLKSQVPVTEDKEEELKAAFRKEFKILDHCRALHAEENAILTLAKYGRSIPLDQCTLYTTTYPCQLCANKIATLGIKRIVYLEPYPNSEAKAILKHHDVTDKFFEGVTFRAYFRIYGEEK